MALEPADISVSVGPYGLKSLNVNGDDLTPYCNSVQISVDADAVPIIRVSLVPAPFDFDGPGIVMIKSAKSDRDTVLAFLSKLSGSWLDAKSLESMSWGNDTPGDLILNALTDLAEGME